MRPLAAVLLAFALAIPAAAQAPERPTNVIFLIADGFGPASATMGRAARGGPLAFDSVLVGTVETSATNSRVTDSAAGATAFACGIKSYNGAIGVGPDGAPCRTVLEAAEARGMATGLVATSRVTHATPAAYAARVARRSMEAEIAAQMAASGVDVLFGGGRAFFDGREDGRDLTAELRAAGAAVALDRAAYDALDATPAVALLAPNHLEYEVDRGWTDQPSLAEMTARALRLLAESADGAARGFFLMVEGSRIDHAAHGNDPVGHLHDILAYDAAVAVALAFAAEHGNTLVVSTSDHETGGMTLARDGVYAWDPEPLMIAAASGERLGATLREGAHPLDAVIAAVGSDLSDEETARVAAASEPGDLVKAYLAIVSERSRIGWTTGGHSAVDVNLYAYGPGRALFHGAMTNDAVGRAVFAALGLSQR
jgi:alkaline phosphatase